MATAPIEGWTNYLSVQAGVAAALTGLVFVAVSINLARILEIPGLTGRAAESLLQLFGVVMVSTTVLIPGQRQFAIGLELLLVGSVLWLVQAGIQLRSVTILTGQPRLWATTRVLQTQLASVPFVIAGILLLRGSSQGLYWLGAGCVLSLVAGVASSWILLVEILR
jgi:hypothetical protein